MKKLILLIAPTVLILVYLIFKIEYYSIITTVLFSIYLISIFLLGRNSLNIMTFLIGLIMLGTIMLQWYSIDETIKWLEDPNYMESWSYGTDFLVLFSWFSLLIVTGTLNYRGYINLGSEK